MANMNHTPTPWAVEYIYGANSTMVYARIYEINNKHQSVGFAGVYKRQTKDEASANAQFIVRACNAHDILVELAERVIVHFAGTDAPLADFARMALKLARGE